MEFIDLADSIKNRIQIMVPYGQLDKYLHNTMFDGFKDLRELSLIQTIRVNIIDTFDGVIIFLGSNIVTLLFFVFGVILVLVWLWYLAFMRLTHQQETSFILIKAFVSSLFITLLAIFAWISVYWFLWFWFFCFTSNNIIPSIIATIVSLSITLFMYKNILYQMRNVTLRGIKSDLRLLFTEHRKGLYRSIMAIALLFIGLLWLRWYINRIDRVNSLYKIAQSEFKKSNDANKAALFVLANCLQRGNIPSTSIKDSIYTLLDILSYEIGYNMERLDSCIGTVNTISLSPNGKLLLSGCDDGFVQVWNMQERKLINTIDCNDWGDIKHCDWINDTTFIASSGQHFHYCNIADSISVWNGYTKKHKGFKILANRLYYIPDNGWRSNDTIINTVYINDKQFRKVDTLFLFANEDIEGICRYKDGLLVYGDSTLKEYNPKTGMLVKLYKSSQSIEDLSFSNDNNKITIMTRDSVHHIDVVDEKIRVIRSVRLKDLDGFILTHSNMMLGYDGDQLFEMRESLDEESSLSHRDYMAKGIKGRNAIVSNDDKYIYTVNNNRELCIIHLNKLKRQELLQIIFRNFIKDKYQLSDAEKCKYDIKE